MEKLLLSRVRRAETEATKYKLLVKEVETDLGEAKQQAQQLEEVRSDQAALILRLEEDLQQAASNVVSAASGGGAPKYTRSMTAPSRHLNVTGDTSAQVLSDVLSGVDLGNKDKLLSGRAGSSANGEDDGSLIDIVQAQRDRFRARLHDVEKEKEKVINERISICLYYC